MRWEHPARSADQPLFFGELLHPWQLRDVQQATHPRAPGAQRRRRGPSVGVGAPTRGRGRGCRCGDGLRRRGGRRRRELGEVGGAACRALERGRRRGRWKKSSCCRLLGCHRRRCRRFRRRRRCCCRCRCRCRRRRRRRRRFPRHGSGSDRSQRVAVSAQEQQRRSDDASGADAKASDSSSTCCSGSGRSSSSSSSNSTSSSAASSAGTRGSIGRSLPPPLPVSHQVRVGERASALKPRLLQLADARSEPALVEHPCGERLCVAPGRKAPSEAPKPRRELSFGRGPPPVLRRQLLTVSQPSSDHERPPALSLVEPAVVRLDGEQLVGRDLGRVIVAELDLRDEQLRVVVELGVVLVPLGVEARRVRR